MFIQENLFGIVIGKMFVIMLTQVASSGIQRKTFWRK